MADEPIGFKAAVFRAWLHLEDYEAAHPDQPVASVFGLRHSRPKACIEDLAREFSGTADSRLPAEKFRRVLQAARIKFLECMREMGHDRAQPSS